MFLVALVWPAQAIPVPTRQTSGVVCVAATWDDILTFFVVNFVTHAVTVRSLPGDRTADVAINTLIALLFPFSGVWAGIMAIRRASCLAKDQVQQAARAGALCILVRTPKWVPREDEVVTGCVIDDAAYWNGSTRIKTTVKVEEENMSTLGDVISPEEEVKVFGYQGRENPRVVLPRDYRFQRIGRYVEIGSYAHFDVPSSRNLAKIFASIVQLLFACGTLWRSRGRQLEQYGYAAFSLTVIPYAIMSLVNLIGNIVTPEYTHVYIVESEVLEEARRRHITFDGTVSRVELREKENVRIMDVHFSDKDGDNWFIREATVTELPEQVQGLLSITVPMGLYPNRAPDLPETIINALSYILAVVVLAAPYAIIAGLTEFKPGHSTVSQRAWMLSWLVVGQVAGLVRAWLINRERIKTGSVRKYYLIILAILFGSAGVGGFVNAGMMIKQFGSCVVV